MALTMGSPPISFSIAISRSMSTCSRVNVMKNSISETIGASSGVSIPRMTMLVRRMVPLPSMVETECL